MTEYENFNDPEVYIHEKTINLNEVTIMTNYLKLLQTYHVLFNKNIVTKKIHYIDFIYKQGMKCLNHIFILLLQYTHNLQFTYYHCEKGIYYFTEFISQIENENSFLKLSSIDAIIFVYKKTIYNINRKMANHNECREISVINSIIKLVNNINTYERYKTLSSYFIKLSSISEEQIDSFHKSFSDQEDLNKIVETLKNEL